MMLIVTEAAEAMEAIRDDNWFPSVTWKAGPNTTGPEIRMEDGKIFFKRVGLDFEADWPEATSQHLRDWGYVPKPEGVPSEMADILIRVLDACAAWAIDIDEAVRLKIAYNATRGQMHDRVR